MSRIAIPTVENAPAAAQPLLAAVKQQLGTVPNLMKLLARNPAALEGYLSFSGALGKGALDAGLRERIALAVAEHNGCDYCLSAHTYLGQHVARLPAGELAAAREARSTDARAAAALGFARAVARQRGQVADAELAAVRAAGFDDAEVLEIVAHVALNVLTNYVNNVALTTVDFPHVAARQAA
jgi:uncharacterized peroxidase-related enzyme